VFPTSDRVYPIHQTVGLHNNILSCASFYAICPLFRFVGVPRFNYKLSQDKIFRPYAMFGGTVWMNFAVNHMEEYEDEAETLWPCGLLLVALSTVISELSFRGARILH
jgi:hypothetical protein